MMKTVSMAGMVLVLAACAAATPAQPQDLALQCELSRCECRNPANLSSHAAPIIWNQNGTAGCAEGLELVLVNERLPSTGLTGGIRLPTFDACATSGPRTGSGNLGRGARSNCNPF